MKLLKFDCIDSTNTYGKANFDTLDDKTVIIANEQTKGRGRFNRVWVSKNCENIYLSLVLKPQNTKYITNLTQYMSVVSADVLKTYNVQPQIKWPNDIYVGDRKIAGILIEHRVAGACIATSLCGIGLNVNQREFLSDAPNPVSLWQLTGKELPLDQALEELLVCIDARYARICDYEGLQKDFLACLYRAEGVYGWRDSGGSFQASIAGLDEYGQLRLLDTEGEERVYAFKEVVYLP